MANVSMPGIYKVGMTTRTPAARLAEANKADTWRPPTEYTVAYKVRVNDVLATEHRLHAYLAEKDWRIHPRREFFRAPLRDIKILLDHVASLGDDDEETEVEYEDSDRGDDSEKEIEYGETDSEEE